MEDCSMRSLISRGFTPRWRSAVLVALTLIVDASVATPASAWWRGGVWIGVPPVVVGPGYYYPPYYYPPYWYPPPGYYYPPPASQASATTPRGPVTYGSMCYAGVYNCAAAPKSPVGSGCTCPGLGAPSYGTVN
jgi:hypothetical protein